MSSSTYRCHTDPLWMKQGDSLTLPYTQYGEYVTVDLRKTILPIPLVDTQSHTITKVGTPRTPLQTSRIVALIFSPPNQSSSITKFDAEFGLIVKKMTFDYFCSFLCSLCACLPTEAALTCACGFICRFAATEAHLQETVLAIRQSCLPSCGVFFFCFPHAARPFKATALIT